MSDLIDDPSPGQNAPEFTVGEISGAVKRVVEGEFGRIRVRGEVGRVTLARSGHLYFDLKDDRNVLGAVSWKGQVAKLSVRPEEGMEVVVTGRLTTFGSQSKYQINVDDVAVAGEGALMAMLEKRKKKLAAEGLFDDARKRPLPYLPEIIGVVTSPTGAVIRDILHRLRDRFPRKVLIWPVVVQGDRAAPEVARAIDGFNAMTPGGAMPRPDLIIVARGGGSIEDLWGFNEEIVARAVAASDIPLISAVGHETDTTLIDFVSDMRAPTPTAAAELAVPVRHELLSFVEGMGARMSNALSQGLGRRDQRLRDVARALPRPDGLLDGPRQRLDRAGDRLPLALTGGVQRRRITLSDKTGSLRPAVLTRQVADERRRLAALGPRLDSALQTMVRRKADALGQRADRLSPASVQREIKRREERVTTTSQRFASLALGQNELRRRKLDALERLRETLGYKATLGRGYAVVRGDGAVITTRGAAAAATALEIEFADGRLDVTGDSSGDGGGGDGGGQGGTRTRPGKKPGAKPGGKSPEQGSLF